MYNLYLHCYSGAEGLGCVQDTIVVIPPCPYSITEDVDDVPFQDCWYARPQLFFQCHLHPTGGWPPKNLSYKIGPDDLLFNLVYFSTFEEMNLPIHGPMEDAEVLKLYEPGPIPCLYVAPVDHMVGRVPSSPCYWLATRPLQSHTSSASTRVHGSPWAVQTRQLQMAGVAATFMRSTLGCGTLAVASHAWVVLLWRRLPCGRKLYKWTKPSVLLRLVGAGGRTERDQMKCAVWFTSVLVRTCMYQYVPSIN